MIDIQDLRIGNLIHPNTGGTVDKEVYWVQTIEMQNGQYVVCGLPPLSSGPNGLTGFENDWQPIPLTSEWLERFGFEKWSGYLIKDAFSPGHPSQRFDLYWSKEDGFMTKSRYQEDQPHFFMRHVQSVHGVQNLYFALTGEELQLKTNEQSNK